MTKTKTNIPAGLKQFTDSITIEQLKILEEAVQKQNSAIDGLSKGMAEMKKSIDNLIRKPSEGISKAELETAVNQYVSNFTGQLAEILKKYLASFRGEVTALRNERKAEHQELLDQRAHQHKVFIRIIIAIPTAALLILFSSGYLHYRNSAVYWGNRAYELAVKQNKENPGDLYEYVIENFSDSTKQNIKKSIRNAERRLRKEQKRK